MNKQAEPVRSPLPPGQRRFGAHMSIAGGLQLAFERGVQAGCDAMQVFVRNHRQWKAKPLRSDEIAAWHRAQKETGIRPVVAHASYLINLAAPQDDIWLKGLQTFLDELSRCDQLRILGLVIHPGAHAGRGEAWGIRRIAQALDAVHQYAASLRPKILLEVVAGQGSSIGYRFEQLAEIISLAHAPQRIGVCLDTCHLFAAGYDISTPRGYEATIAELDRLIGMKRVMCIHANDSKKPAGSRVDRHAHIGRGLIGTRGFRNFINDERFFGVPMLLETEKGFDQRGRDWDRVNLARLRRLIKR